MKLHIQLNDDIASVLLDEGLQGLPADFADSIRGNAVKRSEVIKLVIHRHLGKLAQPSTDDRAVALLAAEGDEA